MMTCHSYGKKMLMASLLRQTTNDNPPMEIGNKPEGLSFFNEIVKVTSIENRCFFVFEFAITQVLF